MIFSPWAFLRLAQLERGRRFPWAARVAYCGGMLDCCGLWHGLEAATTPRGRPRHAS